MSASDPRHWAAFPLFDPNQGHVVRSPAGEGKGYWVGAPTTYFDPTDESIYLVYRVRRPRGVHPDRGAEITVARSSDGLNFEDIWTGFKETLNTTSIEKCAVERLPDGQWVFYVSFVDPADGRWRIDMATADSPAKFDLSKRRPVLSAMSTQSEGVKDPCIFRVANQWHMVVSYATAAGSAAAEDLHGTHDAYNTGLIKSRTGLAISADGVDWQWQGEIFGPPETGWDKYCSRIGTVWREDGIWMAVYDGSADVSENYEERCGLAYSFDLRTFHRVSVGGPIIEQPNASGALRYFDVLKRDSRTLIYYETTRPDGSHDLRVIERSA